MFYHALTGNGGSAPVEDLEPVLLWTNPNPKIDFDTQTVSLDLTDYAGVIVEMNANTDTSNYTTCTRVFCKKSDPDYFGGGVAVAGGALGRTFSVTNEGVFFGKGYLTNSIANGNAVPTKIYGVKEYVVEPVDSVSISSPKEFTTAGIDCQIGEYYQLMSNSGNQAFDGFSGADTLLKYSSSGAYTIICKTTSTHINVGSTTSGTYCQIILNK